MPEKNYAVGDLLAMEACTGCRLCAEVCPAVLASENGRLSGVYRLAELRKINRRRTGWLSRFFGRQSLSPEKLAPYGETVFKCTLCGNCQEVCPVGIHLKDIWLMLRQDLVQSRAYPRQIDRIRDNLFNSHNVFDEENEERADWVEDMDDPPDHGFIKDSAEVVYFTGCVSAYFSMAQQIPISLAEIFTASKVDFTLLGKDEWCCGFPLLGAGLKDHAADIIAHNMEAIRKKGAKTVVFACPSCFQMWKEHYPPEFEIIHITQYLHRLIQDNRLPLKSLNLTVTYHDPCDLGRGARVFDPPREVVRSVPGVRFVEMENNREKCMCCGGGGNLEMIDAGLSGKIAGQKIQEVLKTGAQAVVTSCQQCVRTMKTYARRNQVDIQVMDITEFLKKALRE